LLTAINRALRDGIVRFGLANLAFRTYGKLTQAMPHTILDNARYRRDGAPDQLPLPPSDMIFLVAGSSDISWFLKAGSWAATSIAATLSAHDVEIDELDSILDFGCGCGRVLRHWRSLYNTKVFGTDYNPTLIEWCRRNLPFAEVGVNHLHPPLKYTDANFDLVYALSVFTHLTEELQLDWIRELFRIVRPGGYLVLSTHGEHYIGRLNAMERQRFLAGDLVVKNDVNAPGSNTCSAYHPKPYVQEHLASDFEIVAFIPEGAKGNPMQDLYLLRRPSSVGRGA
jgi:SAM-dependent methyltransferase